MGWGETSIVLGCGGGCMDLSRVLRPETETLEEVEMEDASEVEIAEDSADP